MAIECMQKPFPDENPALRDACEDLVSRTTQAWINLDNLTPLEKMGWTGAGSGMGDLLQY